MNRITLEGRMEHDPAFRHLVDSLAAAIERLELTPTEVREAAVYACVKVEERRLTGRFITRSALGDVRQSLDGLGRMLDQMERAGLVEDDGRDAPRRKRSVDVAAPILTPEKTGTLKPPARVVLEWTAELDTGAMRWKEVLMAPDGVQRITYVLGTVFDLACAILKEGCLCSVCGGDGDGANRGDRCRDCQGSGLSEAANAFLSTHKSELLIGPRR